MVFKDIMYGGVLLTEYCKQNGISYASVRREFRKYRLLEEYDSLTDYDILTIIFSGKKDEEYTGNYKYYYKGMPLKIFCDEHPEYKYTSIISSIRYALRIDPNVNIEKIIDNYIENMDNGGKSRYYVGDVPLKEYCEANGFNYSYMLRLIGRKKNNPEYKGRTLKEITTDIILNHNKRLPRMYKGQSLHSYCIQNDCLYSSVRQYIVKRVDTWDKPIEELIDEAVESCKRHGIKYFYEGKTLVDYCKSHNLNVGTIAGGIRKDLEKNPKEDINEIVKRNVEKIRRKRVKYIYNGVPLVDYCKKNDVDYNNVMNRYNTNLKKGLDEEEALKKAVESLYTDKPVRVKYMFDGISLSKYCKKNNIPYNNIIQKIWALKKKNNDKTDDEIIKMALEEYKKTTDKKAFRNALKELRVTKDVNRLEPLCRELHLDFQNVYDLTLDGFTFYQAAAILLFYSDINDKNGYPLITDQRLLIVLEIVKRLKNNPDLEKVNLYTLIVIYKCDLLDTRPLLIKKMKNYTKKIVYEICPQYGISYTDYESYKEYIDLVEEYILKAVDRVSSTNEAEVISYFNLTVKGLFRSHLEKEKVFGMRFEDLKYKDKPIVDYCTECGIPEKIIKGNMSRRRTNVAYNSYSDEQLLDIVIQDYLKNNVKFMYKDIPLYSYCKKHDIDYKKVINAINRYINFNKNAQELTENEIVEMVVNQFDEDENVRLMYKGQPLYAYCSEQNINFLNIYLYIKKNREIANVSLDELIEEAITLYGDDGVVIMIEGQKLPDYARANGYNPASLRSAVKRVMKTHPELSRDECVKKALEDFKHSNTKYFIDGKSFKQICDERGLNYNSVMVKYRNEYKDRKDITEEEGLRQCLEASINGKKRRENARYSVKGETLTQYCAKKNLPYPKMVEIITRLERDDKTSSMEQLIAKATLEYRNSLQKDQISEGFKKLEEISEINGLSDACKLFGVNFICALNLVNKEGFTMHQAVTMIYFFSDEKAKDGSLSLSYNKISQIIKLKEILANDLSDSKIMKVDLFYLVALYKCKLLNTKSLILRREKDLVNSVIFDICNEFNVSYGAKTYDMFVVEVKSYLMDAIDLTNTKSEKEIVAFIDKYVCDRFRSYIKNIYIKRKKLVPGE